MPKHHYNPNFILRRFADDSDTLWVLDKDTGRCWPKKGGRQNRYDAFAENGYNTVKNARGADDDSVEDFYTEVEARAAPIIDTLVSTAHARLLPHIGPVDKGASGPVPLGTAHPLSVRANRRFGERHRTPRHGGGSSRHLHRVWHPALRHP